MVSARVLIDAPVRTPAPFGLAAAATVQPLPNPQAQNGIEYETIGCGTSNSIGITCGNRNGSKQLPAGGPELVVADPFAVYDSFRCFPRDDARQIATQRLARGAWSGVEKALSTGMASPLSFANAQVLTTNAVDLVDALSLLEAALADVCVTGAIIHAPRAAAIELGAAGLLTRDTNVLRDPLGTAFAFGCGYGRGVDPAGYTMPDDGTFWMYATGPMTIWRGDVQMSPASGSIFVPTDNDMIVLAEQVYLVGIECGVFAVPVCADMCVVRPVITATSPAAIPAGAPTTVVVTGVFGADPVVLVNGGRVPTTVISDTQVSAQVPAMPGPDAVSVVLSDACWINSAPVSIPVEVALAARKTRKTRATTASAT